MKWMSQLYFPCFAILLVGASVSAQDNDLAGHWIGPITRGDRSGSVSLDLTTSTGNISGTLSDPSGQVMKVQNFKLDGSHFTFDAWGKEHGKLVELHFLGDVSNSEIKLHRDMGSKSGPIIVLRRPGQ